MGHDMGWGFMGLGWIFWIVIILAIIWIVARLSASNIRRKEPPATKGALEILKERFAKGEISKEEFEEKKKSLE